jgi:hypothetical protein
MQPPPWHKNTKRKDSKYPLDPLKIRCTKLESLVVNNYHDIDHTRTVVSQLLMVCGNLKQFTWWDSALSDSFPLPGSLTYLCTGGADYREVEGNERDAKSKISFNAFRGLLKRTPALKRLEFSIYKVGLPKSQGKRLLEYLAIALLPQLLTIKITEVPSNVRESYFAPLEKHFPSALVWTKGDDEGELEVRCWIVRKC